MKRIIGWIPELTVIMLPGWRRTGEDPDLTHQEPAKAKEQLRTG